MRNDAQERTVLVEERALQAAMLAGDVDELDRLLHLSCSPLVPMGS